MNIFPKQPETALTKLTKLGYSSLALGKISRLVLADYESLAHTVRLMGFFCMRNISMRSHVMAELERDTFMCAGSLCCLSANPFQPRHHYLAVIGKASIKNIGAHFHA